MCCWTLSATMGLFKHWLKYICYPSKWIEAYQVTDVPMVLVLNILVIALRLVNNPNGGSVKTVMFMPLKHNTM